MKIPVVELSDCILCGVCVESCPEAFRMNAAGYIEVIDLADYPEKEVNEAIKNCPADCIDWQEELNRSDDWTSGSRRNGSGRAEIRRHRHNPAEPEPKKELISKTGKNKR